MEPIVPTTKLDIFISKTQDIYQQEKDLQVCCIEDTTKAIELRKQAKSLENEIEEMRTSITKPMNDYLSQINLRAKELKQPVLDTIWLIDKKIKDFQAEEQRKADELRKAEQKRLDDERRVREEEDRKRKEEEDKRRKEEEAKIAEQKRIADEKMKEANKASDDVQKKRLEAEAKIAEDRRQLEEEKRAFEEKKRQEAEAQRKAQEQAKWEQDQLELAKVWQTEKVKWLKSRLVFEITDETLVPRQYMSIDEKKIREHIKNGIRIIDWVKIFEQKWF